MRLKLLDAQWHIGHQYEMLKFPFVDWYWLKQYKRPRLNHSTRGDITDLFTEVLYYEPGEYDAAILHLDQECLTPRSLNRGKGTIYHDMNNLIQDIPKIVIMHGAPHFPEGPPPYNDPAYLVDRLREVVGVNHLVVNSHQASLQWRMGVPIIHGLDASEWFDLPKVARVITTLPPGSMTSYYDRPFLAEVKELLSAMDIVHCHIGVDYIPSDWADYRRMIGESLIYFNPTLASPMPRARTEAMLSGCCVVTTPHHDASSFIQHGINGFLIDRSPKAAALLIQELLNDPHRALDIGSKGRETAQRVFEWRRFARDWELFLMNTLSLHPPGVCPPIGRPPHE